MIERGGRERKRGKPNDATERRSQAFWLWKIFRRGRLIVEIRRLKQPHLHRNCMIYWCKLDYYASGKRLKPAIR